MVPVSLKRISEITSITGSNTLVRAKAPRPRVQPPVLSSTTVGTLEASCGTKRMS